VRHRPFATFAAAAALIALPLTAALSLAQGRGEAQQQASRPTPRLPDGRVNFGSPAGETGIWLPFGRPLLADPVGVPITAEDPQGRSAFSGPPFPGKPNEDQVPFQDWARALFKYRETNLYEPYIRCKPSGGARQFIAPFGVEFFEVPENKTMYIFDLGGSSRTFRTIYMDGRSHPDPKEWVPTYYGHAIGRWEGDTLVVDSVGFNERMWIERYGMPHTEQLHLIERFTRLDMNTMKIEYTIDDPGAYTRTWTTGINLRWDAGNEGYEFICQENNTMTRNSEITP
jgi:hypothetical protein